MRFTTLFAANGKAYLVRLKDGIAEPIGRAYAKPGVDPLREMLDAGRDPKRVRAIAKPFPVRGRRYGPAVTAPQKVIAVGLNYKKHQDESGLPVPVAPQSFCKYTSSLNGHNQPIKFRRKDSKRVDYECELAFVVGRRARDVARAKALDYVFGYTLINDVSARDHQFTEGQVGRAKGFDTFTPMGPCIVTADEIPDPQALMIRTRLNGKVMQEESTADMIFDCAHILSYLSRFLTLEPGDVVSTGTPSGVGFARKPPVFMKHGDVVEVEADVIGTLRNRVRVAT